MHKMVVAIGFREAIAIYFLFKLFQLNILLFESNGNLFKASAIHAPSAFQLS